MFQPLRSYTHHAAAAADHGSEEIEIDRQSNQTCQTSTHKNLTDSEYPQTSIYHARTSAMGIGLKLTLLSQERILSTSTPSIFRTMVT